MEKGSEGEEGSKRQSLDAIGTRFAKGKEEEECKKKEGKKRKEGKGGWR